MSAFSLASVFLAGAATVVGALALRIGNVPLAIVDAVVVAVNIGLLIWRARMGVL